MFLPWSRRISNGCLNYWIAPRACRWWRAAGFISASLHRSLDGSRVTIYAQWRSLEDYRAMRDDPEPLPYLQQALAIAKFEPAMYQVVETYLS